MGWVGLGLSLVSDTSDRPGQQEAVLLRTKKHFATKMDPCSWTPTNPENFKARRTGFWASRHGWQVCALASFTVGGFQLEGYAITLRTYTLTPRYSFGLQLGDVRQRGRQRLRGRHRHLPWHGRAGCLEHGAPGLLGATRQSSTSEPSEARSPGWCSSRRALFYTFCNAALFGRCIMPRP